MTHTHRIAALAVAALIGLAAVPAQASDETCTKEPQTAWRTMADVTAALAAQGLEVREVEIEGSCYEAYVRDKDGRRTKLYLDPMTLATVRSEKKS